MEIFTEAFLHAHSKFSVRYPRNELTKKDMVVDYPRGDSPRRPLLLLRPLLQSRTISAQEFLVYAI